MKREISMVLNGAPVTVEVEETASLLDVLRAELELTGPRLGYGSGDCGTCAVIIDGEDRASCEVEVAQVEGRHVTTVEGIGTADAPPWGTGEISQGATMAAIGNAVAQALGERIRVMPFTRERITSALLKESS
jgi:aerobic-type carbon monoxide dehydrogenase small subunit (CoxS/CutS family)